MRKWMSVDDVSECIAGWLGNPLIMVRGLDNPETPRVYFPGGVTRTFFYNWAYAKRWAQAHLRSRVMKFYDSCPVCGEPTPKEGAEKIEGILIAYKAECRACNLFLDVFDAGVRDETIGYVTFHTSWQDETPQKWGTKDAVIEEAKRLHAYPTTPPARDTPLLILLGWFEDEAETKFPLNEEALRAKMATDVGIPGPVEGGSAGV